MNEFRFSMIFVGVHNKYVPTIQYHEYVVGCNNHRFKQTNHNFPPSLKPSLTCSSPLQENGPEKSSSTSNRSSEISILASSMLLRVLHFGAISAQS